MGASHINLPDIVNYMILHEIKKILVSWGEGAPEACPPPD